MQPQNTQTLIFCAKQRVLGNLCKLLSINVKVAIGRARKNVLTVERGHFWGLLAEKQGVRPGKKAFYFALFHVLVFFFVCNSLSARIFRQIFVSKKNRAKKPTVGFWLLADSGNIVS
jgi:hypothetical protein